jgi:hypothetical protein
VIILALLAARSLPYRTLAVFGYLALVTALMGALAMGYGVGDPAYFFALAACVALIAIASVLKCAPIQPDTDWPAHARCIGGPVPCMVPIDPPEWSVAWPGNDSYRVRPP